MRPKAQHLIPYFLLETIDHGSGNDHGAETEGYCGYGNTNNKCRKTLAAAKRNLADNKQFEIHATRLRFRTESKNDLGAPPIAARRCPAIGVRLLQASLRFGAPLRYALPLSRHLPHPSRNSRPQR